MADSLPPAAGVPVAGGIADAPSGWPGEQGAGLAGKRESGARKPAAPGQGEGAPRSGRKRPRPKKPGRSTPTPSRQAPEAGRKPAAQ